MPRWRNLVQKILPLAISAALVAWLLSWISLDKLAAAAGALNWRLLAPLTAAMVLALFAWEALCLKAVFLLRGRPLGYRQMLRVRGISYLAGAFNYELGQAFVAWNMMRLLKVDLLFTLSRSVLLAYHDLFVLLAMGLLGWQLSDGAAPRGIGAVCSLGLTVLAIVGMAIALLPRRWHKRLRATRWGAWLNSWSLGASLRLAGLRVGYFSILILYGALALSICNIHASPTLVLSTLPLMLVADSLPSVAGLGTRETALLLLLKPQEPEQLMAMSLFWSTGMIVGRLIIGLIVLWSPRREETEEASGT
jgi:hypothetical protein